MYTLSLVSGLGLSGEARPQAEHLSQELLGREEARGDLLTHPLRYSGQWEPLEV